MVRVQENINQTGSGRINLVQPQEQRKELLLEMINLVNQTPYEAQIDFGCGLGWTKYYERMKFGLLSKYQQLIANYRQSELEDQSHSNLTLILADLRKNIILIDSIWPNDSRELTYYQKLVLTTCQHLLKWEN